MRHIVVRPAKPASPNRSLAMRWLGLAVVLTCLGGQLSSLVHLLLVRHVTCPEHGELVHATSPRPSPAPHAEPAIGAGSSSETVDTHEHCVLASYRGEGFTVEPAQVQSAPPPPRAAVGPAPRPAPPPAPIALRFLAPKQSPPV